MRSKLPVTQAVDKPSDDFQGGGPHWGKFPVERAASRKRHRNNVEEQHFAQVGDTRSRLPLSQATNGLQGSSRPPAGAETWWH